jgi:hypothetical protein
MSKHESRIPCGICWIMHERYTLSFNTSRGRTLTQTACSIWLWSAYWKSLVRQQAESSRKNVSTILEYHGRRLSACEIASFMVRIWWTSRFFGGRRSRTSHRS